MSADDKADAAWDDYVSQQQEEKIEQLERELNEANERIKRLEEAGQELNDLCVSRWMGDTLDQATMVCAIHRWNKAKEVKP